MLKPKQKELLPWDKSWIIRLAFLDLINGIGPWRAMYWLEQHRDELSDDLLALLRTLKQYQRGEALDVGESATLLRFWRYFLWMRGDKRAIIVRGTLKSRRVDINPALIAWEVDALADRHHEKSSQWASAAILHGKNGRRHDIDPHIALSYEAREEWLASLRENRMWTPRKDANITECMATWVMWRQYGFMPLVVDNAEKACQAVAFGLMTPDEMAERWPKSLNHESVRPDAMRQALAHPWWIVSNDHRVVMSMALLGVPRECFSNPDCVAKSFPRFWDFLNTVD